MTTEQQLSKAIDYILHIDNTHVICKTLHENKKELTRCALECNDMCEECVRRFLNLKES